MFWDLSMEKKILCILDISVYFSPFDSRVLYIGIFSAVSTIQILYILCSGYVSALSISKSTKVCFSLWHPLDWINNHSRNLVQLSADNALHSNHTLTTLANKVYTKSFNVYLSPQMPSWWTMGIKWLRDGKVARLRKQSRVSAPKFGTPQL